MGESKKSKKKEGEFFSFSLNVTRDPFSIPHVRTKGLLPEHFVSLPMLVCNFGAALNTGQQIPEGKKC